MSNLQPTTPILLSLLLVININIIHIHADFDCTTRRCCRPKPNSPHQGSFTVNCNTLLLEDCILNNDICSWDCTPIHSQERNRILTNAGYVKKTFKRIAKGNGVYEDAIFVGQEPPSPLHGEATTIDEVIEYTKLSSIDDCGIEYEYELDTVAATAELDKIKQRKKNPKSQRDPGINDRGKDQSDKIRRLTIFDPDTRTQIFGRDEMAFSGYLQFVAAGGVPKRCSASLIAPNWIITAAHCVNNGRGPFYGEWYSQWKFYPGLVSAVSMSALAVPALQAWTFNQWTSNGYALNWDYDIAWIELDVIDLGIEPLSLEYDGAIQNGQNFNIVGYPGDKPWLTRWHQFCAWEVVTNEIIYTKTCDITGGSSGSPVYKLSSTTFQRTVQCIVSWENTAYNGCARINEDKITSICGTIGNCPAS